MRPEQRPLQILHAAAEIFPFVKTGGLGDVLGALPRALQSAGVQVRLVLPAMPALSSELRHGQPVAQRAADVSAPAFTLLRGQLGDDGPMCYLIDAPELYARDGGPYQDAHGRDWPDNLRRFALLSRCAAELAAGRLDPSWSAAVLHVHDWHTALACAYLRQLGSDVRSILTVHNLAYAGLFPLEAFGELGLDPQLICAGAPLEFYGQLSLLKAGLVLADHVTTVSPSYAREIATPEFGCGFDGVIRARGTAVTGLLNGIDTAVWNPATDTALAARFNAARPGNKRYCKRALLKEFNLDDDLTRPLFGIVSRLSGQKGIDLVLSVVPRLQQLGGTLVLLGSGEAALEQACRDAAQRAPRRVGVHIGYDETRAHRLIAGADVLLVPSRFEPCGLTQLYALRYGTLPLVRRVGGLADTIDESVGFPFGPQDTGFESALETAVAAYRNASRWRALRRNAMLREHDWSHAALEYLALYQRLLKAD